MSPDVICGYCSLGFTGTYIKEREERKKGGVEGVEGREKERGKFGRSG